jgi:hypothetical protein
VALERQNKELKAKFVELETMKIMKTKATSSTSRGKSSNNFGEQWQACRQKL